MPLPIQAQMLQEVYLVTGFGPSPGRRYRHSMRLEEPGIGRREAVAFTLTEVVVSLFVLGIMVVSLYAAFSSGFAVVRLSRENSRATQIIVQRLANLRRYTETTISNP